MSNINKPRSNSWKSFNFRSLWYTAIVAALLNMWNPSIIRADSGKLNIWEKVEQVDNRNMVDRVQQATWVKLPEEYNELIRDFIQFGDVFNDHEVCEYTINFICDKMRTDLWKTITKENQLLWIRCKVFVCLFNESPYDWWDNDEERFQQFKANIDFFDDCWEQYIEWIKTMTKRRTEEANERIKKSDEQMIKLNYEWLKDLAEFFQIWESNPELVKEQEIEQSIKYAKDIVEGCKSYNINYKNERLKELKDEKRLNKMLKLLKIQ